jgi:hypothetical protein
MPRARINGCSRTGNKQKAAAAKRAAAAAAAEQESSAAAKEDAAATIEKEQEVEQAAAAAEHNTESIQKKTRSRTRRVRFKVAGRDRSKGPMHGWSWGRKYRPYPYDWFRMPAKREIRELQHDHHALRACLWAGRVAQHVEAGCEGEFVRGYREDMDWVSRSSHRSWCPSGLPDPMLQCGRWCFDGRRITCKADAEMVRQWEEVERENAREGKWS